MAPATERPGALQRQAAALAQVVKGEIAIAIELGTRLGGRVNASDGIDWKSFEATAAVGAQASSQELVAWVPLVTEEERARFEADSGRDAFRSLRIVETSMHAAHLVASSPRPSHHPIVLTAPLSRGADLLGLDLASVPAFEDALGERKDRARIVGPLTLLSGRACGDQRRLGCTSQLFVLVPVGDVAANGGMTFASKRARGFVAVALSWPRLVEAARMAPGVAGDVSEGASTGIARGSRRHGFGAEAARFGAARAGFDVAGSAFTIELLSPPGGVLSARLTGTTASSGQ